MNKQNYFRVSIKGIVIDKDNRILLAKEDNGKWEMLGGGLDHGENPIEGLKREVREETGLEVTYISKAPIYFLTFNADGEDKYRANIIYEIKLKDMNFKPSDECIELRFFSIEEMKSIDLFNNVEKLLEIIEGKENKVKLPKR